MKRKVIKQGNNTLTITLPKDWTDRFGVKVGDELTFEEKNHALLIHPRQTTDSKSIEIDIPKGAPFRKRFLLGAYVKGYDRIVVRFHDKDLIRRITDCVGIMIGFEMIEQKENSCVLVNVASGINDEFEHMASRMLNVCIDMAQSTYDALAKNEHERLGNIAAMESLANRLHQFCKRTLNKMHRATADITSLYRINCSFEEITDFYHDMCNAAAATRTPVRKPLLDILVLLRGHLQLLRHAGAEVSMDYLERLFVSEDAIQKKIRSVDRADKLSIAILIAASGILEAVHAISEELR